MKLFRTTDTLLVCAMIAAAAFTYKLKHDAEGQLAALRRVEADIRLERETIEVIKADWALFTQPSRLQRLADAHAAELQLRPLEPTQIGTLAELPERQVDIEMLIRSNPGGMAGLGQSPDPTMTGAITTKAVKP